MDEKLIRHKELMPEGGPAPLLVPGVYDRGDSSVRVKVDGTVEIDALGWGEGSIVTFPFSKPMDLKAGDTMTVTLTRTKGPAGGYMNAWLQTGSGRKAVALNANDAVMFKSHAYTAAEAQTVTGLAYGKQTGVQSEFAFTVKLEVS